jgi:uncharacterized Tic20 family protein
MIVRYFIFILFLVLLGLILFVVIKPVVFWVSKKIKKDYIKYEKKFK